MVISIVFTLAAESMKASRYVPDESVRAPKVVFALKALILKGISHDAVIFQTLKFNQFYDLLNTGICL